MEFDERQTAMLVRGKSFGYEGEFYTKDLKWIFTPEKESY